MTSPKPARPDNHVKKLLILIAFFALPARGGEVAKFLTADFTKIKKSESTGDTVKGSAHWFENRLVIKVTAPIAQYMVIDSLQTIIYNPSENTGIRMIRKTRDFLPFFNTFSGFFKGEQVAPQVNFKIKTSVRKNDSLYTEWVPDGGKTSFRGKFEAVFYNDKPVRATTYDKKGALLYQMSFGHDTLINGTHVPLRIRARTPARSGSILEDVEFSNVSVNKPIPGEIAKFKIPPEASIKVMEW
jgi:hypothetical protein